MDLKLGNGPKAGNFLSGKREGKGGRGERETEIEGRDREIGGRNREIHGRDIEIEGRDIETEKQRNGADNKNPKQSWVAQLVQYNLVKLKKLLSSVEDCPNHLNILINDLIDPLHHNNYYNLQTALKYV